METWKAGFDGHLVKPVTFDMLHAPVARGHFLGDYQGLARRGNRMLAVFGVATVNRRTNIVSRIFR